MRKTSRSALSRLCERGTAPCRAASQRLHGRRFCAASAAILVVTDRTVESALTQIYRKLDVRSRTELARRLGTTA
jgi:Bacterial regulatory proteins, luxR family